MHPGGLCARETPKGPQAFKCPGSPQCRSSVGGRDGGVEGGGRSLNQLTREEETDPKGAAPAQSSKSRPCTPFTLSKQRISAGLGFKKGTHGQAWLRLWRGGPFLLGTEQRPGMAQTMEGRPLSAGDRAGGQAWLRLWRGHPALLEAWRVHGGPTMAAGGAYLHLIQLPIRADAPPTCLPPGRHEVPTPPPIHAVQPGITPAPAWIP